MPKGTRVSRCVEKVKKSKDEGAAIAICQASTKQGYATGKTLKEALATKFGSKGSKLSKTSSRHATNPGESKAEARDDATKFTKRHGQQASQTHKQTGKIPGPKPGEKNEQVEAYRDLAYRIDELLPALAAGAARVGAAVGRGVAAAGRGAARMLKRKAARKAIASAQGVATGGDAAKKQAELGQQAASDKDLEENKMNNAYLRKLMEMEGPTDKDLDDIKKEKPAKIPKKKYFGGETDPKKVDTKAAIASHKKGIRAAGEATKKKPEELPEATGGPNTAPVTDKDRKAGASLAAHGRGGPDDTSKSNEPKRSPSGSKRSKRTKAADDAAGVVVSHTEYQRIGALMAEALGLTTRRDS